MRNVLIADKDPQTRAWYAHLVYTLGHNPILCDDAISVLDNATSGEDLDLILTDIDLPGAWGEQLIEVLRSVDRLAHVPILVVSAPRTRTELMRLLMIGVRQWFEKPPAAEELSEAIRNCLDRTAALDLFDVEEGRAIPSVFGTDEGCEQGSWLLNAS